MSAAVHTLPGVDPPRARLLDLVGERVILRTRRRLAWLQSLADSERDSLLRETLDTPAAEAEYLARTAPLHALGLRLADVEARLAVAPEAADLRQLASTFELSPGELDVLAACLALELSPALGPAFAALSHTPCVTEPLVRRLFGHDRDALVLPSAGSLLRWRLVTVDDVVPGEPAPLRCDPQVRVWLSDQPAVAATIAPVIRPLPDLPSLESWPTPALTTTLAAHLRAGTAVRLVIAGRTGSGRRSLAASVLRALGMPVFSVLTSRIDDTAWQDSCLLIARDALALGVAPVWEHIEGRSPPACLTALAIQAVVCAADERPPVLDGVLDVRVTLPALTVDERVGLWHRHHPPARTWPEDQLRTIASRYPLTPGDLAAVVRHRPKTATEAADRCREVTRHRLGELGQLLRCEFVWDDLVVAPRLRSRLDELAFEARDRALFWELPQARRLYPRGTGLLALFTGTAGTGKTMAAQVLAADLGLDLVRIDLAAVISKYIGETAKNLRRIFRTAADLGAVLLFDEADALFAKRTDVRDSHDRHANTDTNYLLQLVEDFAGLAILATNKKANLDAAFTRRIRHILDFPRPDVPARRRIWQRLLDELGASAPDPSLDHLAALDLSGAQIKNAILAAVFVARSRGEPLRVPHIIRGVERELDKDGRVLDARDRGRMQTNG
jgi:hypothetical protein